MLKFALIGDGQVAKYHRKAIEHVGGQIVWVFDPIHNYGSLDDFLCDITKNRVDYYVIASPTQFHRTQMKLLLSYSNQNWKNFQIICEKPAFLPWETPIDDSRINVVLQLRYLPNLPEKAEKVVAHFVRDKAYFKSWKGDSKKTGGLFFSLFIHYIDLAIQLGADFEGSINLPDDQLPKFWEVNGPKKNHRRYIRYKTKNHPEYIKRGCSEYRLGMMSLEEIDMQIAYNRMYEAILAGNGIKPSDLFYLFWILQKNSDIFGYGRDAIGKKIKIGKELL